MHLGYFCCWHRLFVNKILNVGFKVGNDFEHGHLIAFGAGILAKLCNHLEAQIVMNPISNFLVRHIAKGFAQFFG